MVNYFWKDDHIIEELIQLATIFLPSGMVNYIGVFRGLVIFRKTKLASPMHHRLELLALLSPF
jgi:hypothetical protein